MLTVRIIENFLSNELSKYCRVSSCLNIAYHGLLAFYCVKRITNPKKDLAHTLAMTVLVSLSLCFSLGLPLACAPIKGAPLARYLLQLAMIITNVAFARLIDTSFGVARLRPLRFS